MLVACGSSPHAGVDAADCGNCHPAQHAEWSSSPHARSDVSAVFAALLPRVEKSLGPVARARCVSCHSPKHSDSDTAITCISCHAAIGNRGERDGQLVVDRQAPLAGPRGNTAAPHRTTRRSLLTASSLCGTCHEVHGPGLLREPTLTEFRATGADDASCAGCHAHSFESAYAPRSTLLSRALVLEVERRGDTVTVSLTNIGARHDVPTGMAALRDLWVEVEAPGQPPRRLLELGSALLRHGEPTALFTDATEIRPRALHAGERRSVTVESKGPVTATLKARAVRRETTDALGLIAFETLEIASNKSP